MPSEHESGLESMINHGNPRKDLVPSCPECDLELVERIKTKYSTHHICHNNDCKMVVF